MRDVEILRCTKKYHVIYLGLHEFIKFSVFNERKIFKKIKSTTLLKHVINELQESELGDKFKHDQSITFEDFKKNHLIFILDEEHVDVDKNLFDIQGRDKKMFTLQILTNY